MYLTYSHGYRAYEEWPDPACDCFGNYRQPVPLTRHSFKLREDMQHAPTIRVPGTFEDVSLVRLCVFISLPYD